MFPLKNTEAYIHANGDRSTLGKELAVRDAAISELGSEIQALTNYVAENNVKNMCPTFPTSGSAAGVDYTTAANGIVTAIGTSTGQTAFYAVNQVANVLPAGNYIASAGSNASEDLRLVVLIKRANNSSVYIECTTSQDKPFTVYADDQFMSIYIRTNGGDKAINGTISPMIRDASITDPTYAPYAKTNVELTADVAGLNNVKSFAGTNDFTFFTNLCAALNAELLNVGDSSIGVVTWTGSNKYLYHATRIENNAIRVMACKTNTLYTMTYEDSTLYLYSYAGTQISS